MRGRCWQPCPAAELGCIADADEGERLGCLFVGNHLLRFLAAAHTHRTCEQTRSIDGSTVMTKDDPSQGSGAMLRVMILISNKMSVDAQCAQTNWWHTCSDSAHNVLHDMHDRCVHMHGIQSPLQNESLTMS